ncbi:MAG: hypothetical protein RLZ55_1773 [Actinomycetota bacterium]
MRAASGARGFGQRVGAEGVDQPGDHMALFARSPRPASLTGSAALVELQVQVAAALIVIKEQNRWPRDIAQQHDIAFSDVILPTLDRLDAAVAIADVDADLAAASDLIVAHSGKPPFTTRAECHAWMTDPDVWLSRNPNPPRSQLPRT